MLRVIGIWSEWFHISFLPAAVSGGMFCISSLFVQYFLYTDTFCTEFLLLPGFCTIVPRDGIGIFNRTKVNKKVMEQSIKMGGGLHSDPLKNKHLKGYFCAIFFIFWCKVFFFYILMQKCIF